MADAAGGRAVKRRVFLAVLVVVLPAAAHAATCTVSATPISFGTYIPSNAGPTDDTARVQVTCTAINQTVSYTIALNAGLNSGGSFANRRMKNGTSFLSYQIYRDSAHTTVWGDGTGGTSTVTGSFNCAVACTNTKRNHTTYGRLPALQWTASPGAHTDTITVTITFN
jgi:spore coat protein U-like protein